MSHAQQDPAAASAPFDSSANGHAIRSVAQDEPFDSSARGVASRTLTQDEPREIAIVAKRFTFEPERVEVAEGERVKLVVTSADGVHGLEIKKFKVNKKVPRGGEPVVIEFVASAAGEYPILCSEYCGKDHESMKGMLIVSAKPAPR